MLNKDIESNIVQRLPVLPGERINDLLLNTLLASDLEALVFAYSHLLYFCKRHN